MTNPKQQYGDKKPGLLKFPMTAQIKAWEALQDGANKYGWYNWRDTPVEIQTYLEAATRHLRLFENGEENARDTAVHNLGAVIACCAIIIDSMAHGTAIDNRKHSPVTCDMLHDSEEMVEHLKDIQKTRNEEKPREGSKLGHAGTLREAYEKFGINSPTPPEKLTRRFL